MKKLVFFSILFLSCAAGQKTGTLSFVTLDEEMTLGREITIQTPKLLRVIRNQEITLFFNQLVKEIGAASDWKGLDYTVFIINESDINHFSLPGGEIYLYRGLIEKTESAGEVAAVLAHEIAHVGRRDAVNRLAVKYSYAFAAQTVIGQNPELAVQILNNLFTQETILDYPGKAEYLADALAVKYMWNANYDPNSLITLLQKIRFCEKETGRTVALLQRTHPTLSNRSYRIRKELANVPYHEGLRKDLAEFKRIQEQLLRIPR
jgi:beta-barrel assembly-enhancing protease